MVEPATFKEAARWCLLRLSGYHRPKRRDQRPSVAFHIKGCKGAAECGGTYVCRVCKVRFGWCDGCDDKHVDLCSPCANRAFQREG